MRDFCKPLIPLNAAKVLQIKDITKKIAFFLRYGK